jgi:histidinol dehydrogenase
MEIIRYPDKKTWNRLTERPVYEISSLDETVSKILEDVRLKGDNALIEYSERFDKVKPDKVRVDSEEFEEAEKLVNNSLKEAMKTAIENVETFHASQKISVHKVRTAEGVECWQKSVPVEKVGLYVPGGTAPLFSTVIMLAVPANIAGCKEIVLCTPPRKNGKIHPAVLVAARMAGITNVFKTGGAQAIAAMAYGTESVPRVYKIFGPGNQYVTAAKQILARNMVAIDMPAGPSEVEVIADDTAVPAFIATDLLSQAEHGADSQVLLVTTSEKILNASLEKLEEFLAVLPRKEYAIQSLAQSKGVLFHTEEEVIDFTNLYAPEHLIISAKNADDLAEKVMNAGSVFLGNYTPESAGDYASGTNHTLPTNGWARQYSGVNLDSFIKKITFQKITDEGLQLIGPVVEILAGAESLDAHKMAVSVRLDELNNVKNK